MRAITQFFCLTINEPWNCCKVWIIRWKGLEQIFHKRSKMASWFVFSAKVSFFLCRFVACFPLKNCFGRKKQFVSRGTSIFLRAPFTSYFFMVQPTCLQSDQTLEKACEKWLDQLPLVATTLGPLEAFSGQPKAVLLYCKWLVSANTLKGLAGYCKNK